MSALDPMARGDAPAHRGLALALRILMFAAAAAGLAYFWHALTGVEARHFEPPQRIVLLEPEPEPIEPEPPEEIELETPDLQDVIEVASVEDVAEAPDVADALDDSLGLDAEGGAGADGFGLRAKKGGRELTLNAPAGGMKASHARYAEGLERELRSLIQSDAALQQLVYTADLWLWIQADGRITRCRVVRSTGDREVDEGIVATLSGASASPPPGDLEQPIRIRVRSSAASSHAASRDGES